MINQTRIDNRNAANAHAMVLQDNIREILTPYLGRKAWKVSGYGGFVAALERSYRELQDQEFAEGHRFHISKSVSWLFTSFRLEDERVEISIGKISDDGELVELFDTEARRTDYTLEEVSDKLEQARDLEEQARQLRASVREFTR